MRAQNKGIAIRANGRTFTRYFWTRRNRKHTLIRCKVINLAVWPKLDQTICERARAFANKETNPAIDAEERGPQLRAAVNHII